LSIEFTIYKETNVTLVIPAGDDKSEGYHELLWISLIGVELWIFSSERLNQVNQLSFMIWEASAKIVEGFRHWTKNDVAGNWTSKIDIMSRSGQNGMPIWSNIQSRLAPKSFWM